MQFIKMICCYTIKYINVHELYKIQEKPTGCGSDVGCYSDCDGTCKFVVTWKGNVDSVDFTLSLTLETGGVDQWIALGLSDDQKMVCKFQHLVVAKLLLYLSISLS